MKTMCLMTPPLLIASFSQKHFTRLIGICGVVKQTVLGSWSSNCRQILDLMPKLTMTSHHAIVKHDCPLLTIINHYQSWATIYYLEVMVTSHHCQPAEVLPWLLISCAHGWCDKMLLMGVKSPVGTQILQCCRSCCLMVIAMVDKTWAKWYIYIYKTINL